MAENSLSIPEAAHRLGAPYNRVYAAVLEGAVPSKREQHGARGVYRIAESDLPRLARELGISLPAGQ